jgi:hypothetical protein
MSVDRHDSRRKIDEQAALGEKICSKEDEILRPSMNSDEPTNAKPFDPPFKQLLNDGLTAGDEDVNLGDVSEAEGSQETGRQRDLGRETCVDKGFDTQLLLSTRVRKKTDLNDGFSPFSYKSRHGLGPPMLAAARCPIQMTNDRGFGWTARAAETAS